jgi:putative transposase
MRASTLDDAAMANLRFGKGAIWEHTIRNDDDFARHVDYIHYNPVKHGLVKRVCDWPYSSFHLYVRRGILTLDWAGDAGDGALSFGERR